MATTPNLLLYKPNRLDDVEVDTSLANNFDIIDTEITGAKTRLTTAEADITALETSQTAATQNAQTALDTVTAIDVRLDVVEKDVETLLGSGGTGTGTGTPTFIDGGSFLDVYSSQSTGLDGGDF